MDDNARKAGITYATKHRQRIKSLLTSKGFLPDDVNNKVFHAYKNYREGFNAAIQWHESHLNLVVFERILEMNQRAIAHGIFPEHRANWIIKNYEKFYEEK